MQATDKKTISSEPGRLAKYVVPATIMLSFVSFWRAAAIVLSDLGSTAYYIGGIAEKAIGKAAPWFILGIMLFSYAVRAVYVESCSMFVPVACTALSARPWADRRESFGFSVNVLTTC